MRTSSEIKSSLYRALKTSDLAAAISGDISIKDRAINSDKEDAIISVVSNIFGQVQECYVYVNIYVQDIHVNGRYEESPRVRTLSRIAADVLNLVLVDGLRLKLEQQDVEILEELHEHVITNKMLCRCINEIT